VLNNDPTRLLRFGAAAEPCRNETSVNRFSVSFTPTLQLAVVDAEAALSKEEGRAPVTANHGRGIPVKTWISEHWIVGHVMVV